METFILFAADPRTNQFKVWLYAQKESRAYMVLQEAVVVDEVFTSGNGIKGLLDCVGYSVVMFVRPKYIERHSLI